MERYRALHSMKSRIKAADYGTIFRSGIYIEVRYFHMRKGRSPLSLERGIPFIQNVHHNFFFSQPCIE